jgi:hypothetical protein
VDKLFISWSGARSRQLAEALNDWLRDRFTYPTFISTGIEKGSRWFDEVQQQLSEAKAGIVCITPASLDSAWMLFEAGALACEVREGRGEARLYTYLHGVQPSELPGPLQGYQSTVTTKEDTYQLLDGLHRLFGLDKRGPDDFDEDWKALGKQISAITPQPVTSMVPGLADRFDRKTFREKTHECVDRSWFARLDGAMETRDGLRTMLAQVEAECGPATYQLFRNLLGEIDGYAMNMRSILFTEKTFGELTSDGQVDIPPGPRTALENRRRTIHTLVAQLVDPRQHPVLDDTVQFDSASCFAEKKAMIHRVERLLSEGGLAADRIRAHFSELLDSDWVFDRIVGCIIGERGEGAQEVSTSAAVDRELELVRAQPGEPSLVPLYYSLRWLRRDCQRHRIDLDRAACTAAAVRGYVDERRLEAQDRVRVLLSDIDAELAEAREPAISEEAAAAKR